MDSGESIYLNAEHEEMLHEIGAAFGNWLSFVGDAFSHPVVYLVIAGVFSAKVRATSSVTWLVFICSTTGVAFSMAKSFSSGVASSVSSVTFATSVVPGVNSARTVRATIFFLKGR